jgi:hypothetical protein
MHPQIHLLRHQTKTILRPVSARMFQAIIQVMLVSETFSKNFECVIEAIFQKVLFERTFA